MKHEIIDTVLNVSDTDITFDGIYEKPYIPIEYMADIKKANLLIIPNEGFRDEGDVLFPETTREFFDFIKETAGDDVIVDIAVSDEDFQCIELHSAAIEVATIIVESALFSIAINLVSSFLYDLIKSITEKPRTHQLKLKLLPKKQIRRKPK